MSTFAPQQISNLTDEKKGTPDHPLDTEKKESPEKVEQIYSDEDKQYLSFLQGRLERAKRQKAKKHPEFNNKNYYEYYEDNEKIANTHHLDPKKNKDDVVVSAGTIEQKLDALLSNINNLNLSSEVLAFDKENNRIHSLGLALEDIIHDTEIREEGDGGGDEEKRMSRQRELLKQGTVFVQEEWVKRWEMKKVLSKKFDGQFKDFNKDGEGWSEQLTKVFEGPSRTMLHGPNVYLGNITEFYMERQPYIFVVIQKDYDEAKTRYGKFENWKYVQRGKVPPNLSEESKTIFDNKWRLTEIKDNSVEIILYQDKPRDEFQIIINGVLMIPIGFPLSAVSPNGEYNITKQIFRIINDKFAYGSSFVQSGSVREISNLIDEMLKLFVLKTRKSFTPAYVNTSGRVIDRKVLSPGRISMGFDPTALQPIAGNEVQGITAGEVSFFEKMRDLIDKSTVSAQFTGQEGKRNQTATEVLEIQRQAKLTLGLTIAACMLLEKKLGYLRLWNILQNWFNPIGSKVVGANDARKLVKTFRKTNKEVPIEGEGPGERMVIPMEGELPSQEAIRAFELEEEKEKGKPVRKIFLSSKGLRNAKLIWYIVVNPKEKESTPFFKLLFREMLADMLTLMQLGSAPNLEGLEEQFSQVWNKGKSKLFQSRNISPDIAGVSGAEGVRTPQQQSQAQGRTGGGSSAPAGGLGGE